MRVRSPREHHLLIPLGLVLAGVAVWAFFWAADHGQFDDLEPHGATLFDDQGDAGDRPI